MRSPSDPRRAEALPDGCRSHLAAGFVRAVADTFLVVDRCHAGAITVGRDGTLISSVGWADSIPAPAAWHQPSRRLLHLADDRFAVHDIGHTAAAVLHVAGDGVLRCTRTPLQQLSWAAEQYLPMWRPRAPADPGPGWLFGTDSRGTRWSWWAVHPAVVAPVHGPGASVIAHAALDDHTALAALQHTDKRPLRLAPWVSLHLFDTRSATPHRELAAMPLPAGAGWRSPTYRVPAQRAAALHAYLRFTRTQKSAVERAGGTDVCILVEGEGPDTVITLEFDSPSHPGIRFRRIDRPFDELGNRGGGLADLNVLFEEDLDSGRLLDEIVARTPGHAIVDV
ncbi:hypothetical protein [Pseudonocardia sp. NPDC049635]|uniref:hypothetical protein n=1 Tax=Pseudonocardia sp. NPDC049635 TaxID=3155506 RepID=UPI0033FD06F8